MSAGNEGGDLRAETGENGVGTCFPATVRSPHACANPVGPGMGGMLVGQFCDQHAGQPRGKPHAGENRPLALRRDSLQSQDLLCDNQAIIDVDAIDPCLDA